MTAWLVHTQCRRHRGRRSFAHALLYGWVELWCQGGAELHGFHQVSVMTPKWFKCQTTPKNVPDTHERGQEFRINGWYWSMGPGQASQHLQGSKSAEYEKLCCTRAMFTVSCTELSSRIRVDYQAHINNISQACVYNMPSKTEDSKSSWHNCIIPPGNFTFHSVTVYPVAIFRGFKIVSIVFFCSNSKADFTPGAGQMAQ